MDHHFKITIRDGHDNLENEVSVPLSVSADDFPERVDLSIDDSGANATFVFDYFSPDTEKIMPMKFQNSTIRIGLKTGRLYQVEFKNFLTANKNSYKDLSDFSAEIDKVEKRKLNNYELGKLVINELVDTPQFSGVRNLKNIAFSA